MVESISSRECLGMGELSREGNLGGPRRIQGLAAAVVVACASVNMSVIRELGSDGAAMTMTMAGQCSLSRRLDRYRNGEEYSYMENRSVECIADG